jgi:hypothetical protein
MTPFNRRHNAAQAAASHPKRSAAAVCSNVAVAAGAECSRDKSIGRAF